MWASATSSLTIKVLRLAGWVLELAWLDLVFDRGLIAGAVAGAIGEHLLLQLFADGADRIGLL